MLMCICARYAMTCTNTLERSSILLKSVSNLHSNNKKNSSSDLISDKYVQLNIPSVFACITLSVSIVSN